MREASAIVNAKKSDVFDVLAYIAFAKAPITRQERVEGRKPLILPNYDEKLQAFLDFVLAQYVVEGVSELDPEKLTPLLHLKYGDIHDAVAQLGGTATIRQAFSASSGTFMPLPPPLNVLFLLPTAARWLTAKW